VQKITDGTLQRLQMMKGNTLFKFGDPVSFGLTSNSCGPKEKDTIGINPLVHERNMRYVLKDVGSNHNEVTWDIVLPPLGEEIDMIKPKTGNEYNSVLYDRYEEYPMGFLIITMKIFEECTTTLWKSAMSGGSQEAVNRLRAQVDNIIFEFAFDHSTSSLHGELFTLNANGIQGELTFVSKGVGIAGLANDLFVNLNLATNNQLLESSK